MVSNRVERVQSVILAELAQIIDHELDNPNLPEFITVYSVKVSPDLRDATVNITFMDDESREVVKKTIEELNKAAGFIRSRLAKRVTLKRHPVLTFRYNPSTRYAATLEPLFEEIRREKAPEKSGGDTEAENDAEADTPIETPED